MSLQIDKNVAENAVLTLAGRLDTTTAPEFEAALEEVLGTAKTLEINMENLEYVSSAGLRVILKAHKAMSAKGSMKLTHVCDSIMEVFDITGFADFLQFE